MEFISKIMYVIIAVLVSVCVFMLLCDKNPSLSAPLKSVVSEYAAQHASVEVEEGAEVEGAEVEGAEAEAGQ